MNATELRAKSVDALQQEVESLLKERFTLRMQRSAGQLGQPHLLRQLGKDIARVKTVLNEKRHGLEFPAQQEAAAEEQAP